MQLSEREKFEWKSRKGGGDFVVKESFTENWTTLTLISFLDEKFPCTTQISLLKEKRQQWKREREWERERRERKREWEKEKKERYMDRWKYR